MLPTLSPATLAAMDTALSLFQGMTPEQHRQNRGRVRMGTPSYVVVSALTEGRRWQLTLVEPREADGDPEFTLTIYDLTKPTGEADAFQGTPWACKIAPVTKKFMWCIYEREAIHVVPEHPLWDHCRTLLQTALSKPWEFEEHRWVKEQRRLKMAQVAPRVVPTGQLASYDGQQLWTLPAQPGVFSAETSGSLIRLTDSLQDSLSASYIPAGYALRQRIGDLVAAIEEGDSRTAFQILDLLRAKLGIKD